MNTERYIRLDPRDNVMVALEDLEKDTTIKVEGRTLRLTEKIPAKHKFFLNDMHPFADVLMYGVLVGKTQFEVAAGSLMNVFNTKHAADSYYRRGHKANWVPPDVSQYTNKTFLGYHRNDGRVGTANYWLFIPTVFCENRNLDVIREALHNELGYGVTEKYKSYTRDLVNAFSKGQDIRNLDHTELMPAAARDRVFKNIDGIKFLNHQGGCGGTYQDSAVLSQLLAAYADHPNVAGVTVLSLGCQHLQTSSFMEEIRKRNPKLEKPILIFEQQLAQSEDALVKTAIHETFQGLVEANRQNREPAPLSELSIGVKCGGSDGFSGISANPAVGFTADMLVALGGKVLLAEFPELCGAEQDIIDRCVDDRSAERFIHLMESYNKLAHEAGSGFHMNPSPGNIRDGLITDAIKSAGAVRKAGRSPVVDVLDYTEPATKAGLSLVCTPGNDVEATTGQAASGATLILFTTGLGTPTGNAVCPTIKIATNTSLARRMSDIIDIDAGAVVSGKKTIEQMGHEILDYCIEAASGNIIPRAVQLNQDDFIPWKRGVSL